MVSKKYILLAVCLINIHFLYAQVFLINNGAHITAMPGVVVQVFGETQNDVGSVLSVEAITGLSAELIVSDGFINNAVAGGNGIFRIKGNWLNNGVFNAGTGSVFFDGHTQIIGGANPTSFHNLSLAGTGDKTQAINLSVSNILNLNDRELLTEDFNIHILNTAPAAIQRTSGFISGTNNGALLRNTNATGIYLFPVGSSLGVQRYRPVEVTPTDALANTYSVRMANTDASIEGYDRTLLPTEICHTNPLFYHRINRTSGSSPAHLSIFFEPSTDGVWDGLAHWTTLPQWAISQGSNVVPSLPPFSVATVSSWDDFSQTPHILYIDNITVDLGVDTAFCQGGAVALDAGAGFDTYLWSPVGAGQYNTVAVSGTYHVTVTSGICSAKDSLTVTVFPNPVVDLGPDTAICSGDTLILDAGAGFANYQWSPPNSGQFFTVTQAGSFHVTVTDNNGCMAVDSVNVSIIPAANATITVSTFVFCENHSPEQFSSAGLNGIWSGQGINSTGLFTPTLAGAGSHQIIYTIAGACGDADTVTIVVNPLPQVDLGGNQSICSGDSVVLDAGSGFLSYNWTPSGSTQTLTATSTGNYGVTVVDNNLCEAYDTVFINVFALQNATIFPVGTFCLNDSSYAMTATDTGGIWSGQGISSSGIFTPSLAGAGSHQIIYTIAGACGDADTVTIMVNPLPQVDLGGNQSICSGDSVVLDAGSGFYAYNWSSGATTESITVSTAGTYSITVTDNNMCANNDVVTLTVDAQKDATILTAGPFCSNASSIQFSAVDVGGTWTGQGISLGGLFNPATAGTGIFEIVYAIVGNCGDADTALITVNPAPSVTLTGFDETCIDAADGWAYATTSGGTQPYNYIWNTGATADTVHNLGPGTYTVTVSDNNACTVVGNVMVLNGVVDCYDYHVVVPNIFSPNGDGVNDVLYVLGIGIEEIDFIIYSRWGEKVFETSDIDEGWDGTFKGKPMDTAVFVYHLKVVYKNMVIETLKGDVTLVR